MSASNLSHTGISGLLCAIVVSFAVIRLFAVSKDQRWDLLPAAGMHQLLVRIFPQLLSLSLRQPLSVQVTARTQAGPAERPVSVMLNRRCDCSLCSVLVQAVVKTANLVLLYSGELCFASPYCIVNISLNPIQC